MLLVFSNPHDYDLDIVLDYLGTYPFQRINSVTSDVLKDANIKEWEMAKFIWLKSQYTIEIDSTSHDIVGTEMQYYLQHLFSDKKNRFIGQNPYRDFTKTEILKEAKEFGLIVPDYIVTNSKSCLLEFYEKQKGQVICKSLYSQVKFTSENNIHRLYTYQIKEEDFEKIPNHFFPSFFQRFVDKKFDLRIFFLKEKFYTAAILAKNDTEYQMDFRKSKKTRIVPYKLPAQIEKILKEMLRKLSIISGSIDFVKGKDGNYYFLEINPSGQFGFISKSCNFAIEKDFAHFIKNNIF